MPKTPEPKPHEEDTVPRQLQSLLTVLSVVRAEYTAFMARDAPEEAKNFAARHAAGKAAVAHAAALSKLLQWSQAMSNAPPSDDGETMGDMLAAARAAMSQYDDGEDDDA